MSTLFDLLLVMLGFSTIVVIHEFGHFAAARWAGVRVLAFAVGFGNALVSYRKGLGWRMGSSEQEYHTHLRSGGGAQISPTEYRLNMLPFGGYVKMLGQDDLNPNAVSAAADSYQRCVPWKKMIIISAGVFLNLVTAGLMFIGVFGMGLKTEAPVIGTVMAGEPAAIAVADSGQVGLKGGDRVLSINGEPADSFNDVSLATAMASRGSTLEITVARESVTEPLVFKVMPVNNPISGLLHIGVGPASSAFIMPVKSERDREAARQALDLMELKGVEPGMRLVQAGNIVNPQRGDALDAACAASGGRPVTAIFEDATGRRVEVSIKPALDLELGAIKLSKDSKQLLDHLRGLVPVMAVGRLTTDSKGYAAGFREGDVIAKLSGPAGTVDYPSLFQGVSLIKQHAGKSLEAVVLRTTDAGVTEPVTLNNVPVSDKGMIGISVSNSAEVNAMLAQSPPMFFDVHDRPLTLPENPLIGRSPCRLIAVNSTPVATLAEARQLMLDAVAAAGGKQTTVELKALPLDETDPAGAVTIQLPIDAQASASLTNLSWSSPFGTAPFEPLETTLKASNPLEAVRMGIAETHRVMTMTYLTFARLFEGTVKVQHLKGPVGIAHFGTLVAERGWVWLLFFFALISVNLAVVNFLPLPIVDGGQFLLIVYEQIRGKPAPIAFQNAAMIAGLILIGISFLFITVNDIRNLFGP